MVFWFGFGELYSAIGVGFDVQRYSDFDPLPKPSSRYPKLTLPLLLLDQGKLAEPSERNQKGKKYPNPIQTLLRTPTHYAQSV